MAERKLEELVSVGPAMRRDFALLGVGTVAELARREPEELYRALCEKTRTRQDICVLDTFRAAVAQARDPKLPREKCQWHYWSRARKLAGSSLPGSASAGRSLAKGSKQRPPVEYPPVKPNRTQPRRPRPVAKGEMSSAV